MLAKLGRFGEQVAANVVATGVVALVVLGAVALFVFGSESVVVEGWQVVLLVVVLLVLIGGEIALFRRTAHPAGASPAAASVPGPHATSSVG